MIAKNYTDLELAAREYAHHNPAKARHDINKAFEAGALWMADEIILQQSAKPKITDGEIIKLVFQDAHLNFNRHAIEYFLKTGTVNGSFHALVIKCMEQSGDRRTTALMVQHIAKLTELYNEIISLRKCESPKMKIASSERLPSETGEYYEQLPE